MMNNDITLEQLSKLFIEQGRKLHGSDNAYPWALGSVIGLVDHNLKYRPQDLQKILNQRYKEVQKELATA